MANICEPVDWEIFNIPPIEPVQYYLILKKKREFNQLIRQNYSKILKHGYIHYCCIVPRYSYLNSGNEIFILFVDEMSNASFLGLRVKVNNESCIYNSNFLLLFLKKSKKELFYQIKDNNVLIQCKPGDAWELFYLIYGAYLRQYLLTVIGTEFFYSFVYSYFIQKDIQLLQMLYKGSKIIKISKKSIYYELFQKCRISVINLIHILMYMPKNIVSTTSSFCSEELSTFSSNFDDWKLHLPVGSTIISELKQKNIKMQFLSLSTDFSLLNDSSHFCESDNVSCKFYPYFSKKNLCRSIPVKRKFQEVDNSEYGVETLPSTSKCSKTSSFATDEFETFCNFKYFSVKSYSDISCIQYLVPKLLRNVPENSDLSSFYVSKNPQYNAHLQREILTSKRNRSKMHLKDSSDKCTYEIKDHTENPAKDYCNNIVQTSRSDIFKAFSFARPLHFCDNTNNPDFCSRFLLNKEVSQTEIHKAVPPVECYLKKNENINDLYGDLSDVGFTTATGKMINISHTAVLTANKIMKDVFYDSPLQSNEETGFNVLENKIYKNLDAFENTSSQKSPIKVLCKSHELIPLIGNRSPGKSKTTGKVYVDPSNSSESKLHYNLESSDFTTAAGKSLSVSCSSVQAANKIMQEVLCEVSEIVTEKTGFDMCHRKKFADLPAFENTATSSKYIPQGIDKMDMDEILVEKFFAETPFDTCDKDFTPIIECNADQNMVKEGNSNKISHIQKPRKSLGGRRSNRYYKL